jgi:hypothetical protein
MQNTYTLYIASAALIGAWLTGAFAFFSLLNVKHSKISEFRQDWINSFRSEVSGFISDFNKCAVIQKKRDRLRTQSDETARKELDKEFYDSYSLLLQHKTNISLRVNRGDTNRKLRELNLLLLSNLDIGAKSLNENKAPSPNELTEEIISTSSNILKLEWERVKKGETGYRMTYIFSALILVLGFIGLLIFSTRLPEIG